MWPTYRVIESSSSSDRRQRAAGLDYMPNPHCMLRKQQLLQFSVNHAKHNYVRQWNVCILLEAAHEAMKEGSCCFFVEPAASTMPLNRQSGDREDTRVRKIRRLGISPHTANFECMVDQGPRHPPIHESGDQEKGIPSMNAQDVPRHPGPRCVRTLARIPHPVTGKDSQWLQQAWSVL